MNDADLLKCVLALECNKAVGTFNYELTPGSTFDFKVKVAAGSITVTVAWACRSQPVSPNDISSFGHFLRESSNKVDRLFVISTTDFALDTVQEAEAHNIDLRVFQVIDSESELHDRYGQFRFDATIQHGTPLHWSAALKPRLHKWTEGDSVEHSAGSSSQFFRVKGDVVTISEIFAEVARARSDCWNNVPVNGPRMPKCLDIHFELAKHHRDLRCPSREMNPDSWMILIEGPENQLFHSTGAERVPVGILHIEGDLWQTSSTGKLFESWRYVERTGEPISEIVHFACCGRVFLVDVVTLERVAGRHTLRLFEEAFDWTSIKARIGSGHTVPEF